MLLRYKLYDKYNLEQLTEMMKLEPNNKKQSEIAHAITFHLIDKKKANGTFIQADGYSGRQSNKR
jgi:hypothetical protein